MKNLLIIGFLLTVTSCGVIDRQMSRITGSASEICHRGVLYLQFTSGSSVALNAKGLPLTCN